MTTSPDDEFIPGMHGRPLDPPYFSGKMADYEMWRAKAEVWKHNTKAKKDSQGSMLFAAQKNPRVEGLILNLTLPVILSSEGIDKIFELLDSKFMPKKKTTSWKSYDAMDDMRRQQMEPVEDFTLRLENQYAQIQRADQSATMSDHVLTMHIIKRYCFDPTSRALLLANMEEMTTRCLVDTVEDIFSGEAPWEDPDKKTKNKPKSPEFIRADDSWHDSVHAAMFNKDSEEDEDAGYGAFRPPFKGSCERCGKPGHPAKFCKLTWQQAQQSLKMQQSNPKSEHAMFAMPCNNCGDPNCEGWEYYSDDEDPVSFMQE